jgi:hypothetical protein
MSGNQKQGAKRHNPQSGRVVFVRRRPQQKVSTLKAIGMRIIPGLVFWFLASSIAGIAAVASLHAQNQALFQAIQQAIAK